MPRPKKGAAGRKPLAKKDANVPAQVECEAEGVRKDGVAEDMSTKCTAGAPPPPEEEYEDEAERLRIVNLVCSAVDQELEARTTAIRAIRDGHIASVTTQFQLLLLKFPAHIRKMPIKQFLAEHCPNTKAQTREDGSLQLDIIQDPDAAMEGFQGPGGSSNAINKEFDFRVQNTPGFGPHRSMADQFGDGVRNHLGGQSQSIEQLSWDEFMVAYRMQSKKEGPFPWETPSLRTPGMFFEVNSGICVGTSYTCVNWRNTMITRNMTPATEKVGQPMHPSQTGTKRVQGSKRKVPTSRGLRM